MFVARQRAAFVARQLQRTARTYASDAHAHHKAVEVNESFSVRRVKTHYIIGIAPPNRADE
jgi:hypothetical protein